MLEKSFSNIKSTKKHLKNDCHLILNRHQVLRNFQLQISVNVFSQVITRHSLQETEHLIPAFQHEHYFPYDSLQLQRIICKSSCRHGSLSDNIGISDLSFISQL